jgi:hypothetical protein
VARDLQYQAEIWDTWRDIRACGDFLKHAVCEFGAYKVIPLGNAKQNLELRLRGNASVVLQYWFCRSVKLRERR